jgi:hypothetical protein
MKLPSLRELDDASREADADGPVPLAGICDQHAVLRETVHSAMRFAAKDLEQAIKIGLVQGLNLGIRIGEARGRRQYSSG